MLYLILLTFLVFFIFWLGDFYLTLRTVKYLGHEIEINPILRFIFRFRGRFVYIFKLVEIGAFLYLVWFLTKFSGLIPFHILLIFILYYSLLVINNSRIYYKATGKESIAFKVIFFALTIATILFIYLNYLIYSDLLISYDALTDCNSKYNEVYWECVKSKEVVNATLPEKLEDILKELNLPIRKPK